jgi:hypothetical protein
VDLTLAAASIGRTPTRALWTPCARSWCARSRLTARRSGAGRMASRQCGRKRREEEAIQILYLEKTPARHVTCPGAAECRTVTHDKHHTFLLVRPGHAHACISMTCLPTVTLIWVVMDCPSNRPVLLNQLSTCHGVPAYLRTEATKEPRQRLFPRTRKQASRVR